MNKEFIDKANEIVKLLKEDKGEAKVCAVCKKVFNGPSVDTAQKLNSLLSSGLKEMEEFCLECLEDQTVV